MIIACLNELSWDSSGKTERNRRNLSSSAGCSKPFRPQKVTQGRALYVAGYPTRSCSSGLPGIKHSLLLWSSKLLSRVQFRPRLLQSNCNSSHPSTLLCLLLLLLFAMLCLFITWLHCITKYVLVLLLRLNFPVTQVRFDCSFWTH
jgi:hypothetical protein